MSDEIQIRANTSLHDAARIDDRKLIEQLINEGAEVNARDGQGNTPLSIAVGLDRGEKKLALDRTLFWVSQGANPSAKNDAGDCVWWKSTPAAQNLMVSEMESLDRRQALDAAANSWCPDPKQADAFADRMTAQAQGNTQGQRQSQGMRR